MLNGLHPVSAIMIIVFTVSLVFHLIEWMREEGVDI
jgi:hypothetical protein